MQQLTTGSPDTTVLVHHISQYCRAINSKFAVSRHQTPLLVPIILERANIYPLPLVLDMYSPEKCWSCPLGCENSINPIHGLSSQSISNPDNQEALSEVSPNCLCRSMDLSVWSIFDVGSLAGSIVPCLCFTGDQLVSICKLLR